MSTPFIKQPVKKKRNWPWIAAGVLLLLIERRLNKDVPPGADPLVGFGPLDRAMMGPTIVEAAQHELCPDTLH